MIQNSELRKRIILGLLLVFVVFIVVYFFIVNTYVSLSLSAGSPKDNLVVGYLQDDGEQKESASLFGIYMVPRSSSSLLVASDDRESRVVLSDKAVIGIKNIAVDLAPQKQLVKIGKDGQGCVGQTKTGSLFSYSCTEGTNSIFTFADKSKGQFENSTLPTTLNAERTETLQYADGIISLITLNSAPAIEYTDIATSDIRQRSLPYSADDSVKIFSNPSSESILVVNSTASQLLYYSSLDAEPVKYTVPTTVSYGACGVFGAKFACAATEITGDENKDVHSEEDGEVAQNVRIVSYDTESKKQQDFTVNKAVNNVCVNNDGIYYKDTRSVLRTIPAGHDTSFTVGSIVSLSCGADSVIYGEGSSLYRLKKESSQLLFNEDRLDISGVYTKNGSISFTTFVAGDQQATLHTYQVSSESLEGRRSEATLPYEVPGDLPIFEMDYDSDTIYIKPHVSITSDRETGTTSIDAEALQITKQEIENQLREDGVLGRFKLVYYFN